MTKVIIDTPNVSVTVEADEPMDAAIKAALGLYRDANGVDVPKAAGPAYGFNASVNLPSNHSEYGRASFHHGDRPVVDG